MQTLLSRWQGVNHFLSPEYPDNFQKWFRQIDWLSDTKLLYSFNYKKKEKVQHNQFAQVCFIASLNKKIVSAILWSWFLGLVYLLGLTGWEITHWNWTLINQCYYWYIAIRVTPWWANYPPEQILNLGYLLYSWFLLDLQIKAMPEEPMHHSSWCSNCNLT